MFRFLPLRALSCFVLLSVQAPAEVAHPDLLGEKATLTTPYSMCGQLVFRSGRFFAQGSGTVVAPQGVLTAAHNLWDARAGWSYKLKFNRARHGGNIVQQTKASKPFVLAGYQNAVLGAGPDSGRAFAQDMGGLWFDTTPADGEFAKWIAKPSLLKGGGYKICLGYGAVEHSGKELLFVEPPKPFRSFRDAFLGTSTITVEAGMSGGPVFVRTAGGGLRVAAVVVAGNDDPPVGGVRAIDDKDAAFIQDYLSD